MELAGYYRINSPSVINQIIDEEAVIINLEQGIYYSLNRTGSFVWDALQKGMSVGIIMQSAVDSFDAESDRVSSAVQTLLVSLIHEELVVAAPIPMNEPELTPVGKKLQFEEPVLNKFTDMQDLLLLDPIHEVDETGWPHPKQEEPFKVG